MYEQVLILLGVTSGIFCAVVPETDTRIMFKPVEVPQTSATDVAASTGALSDSTRPVVYMFALNSTHAVQQIFYGQWPSNYRANNCNTCTRKVTRDDYSVSEGFAHKLIRRKLKWGEARKVCIDEGGHMVVLNSLAEEGVVLNMIRSIEQVGEIWLGIHDMFVEDEWITVTGESLEQAGYNKWEPNKPDNAGGNEHCGVLFSNGLIDDRSCDGSRSFVCEIDICKD
ncbi:hemolymph lipopolysaccharide-binding protein [Hylaeus volcanicus]|uniref:hemolymph lipopolysaccharide-binding protein n=1 Tax=Hylaeus volcanicus TaxID=313075 RepID=UPI0023B86439|nr:hemolymph lipopolysaccharide-binding protein [Hylaeus volcanicus]